MQSHIQLSIGLNKFRPNLNLNISLAILNELITLNPKNGSCD